MVGHGDARKSASYPFNVMDIRGGQELGHSRGNYWISVIIEAVHVEKHKLQTCEPAKRG
jgi:hypothetical protein